MTKLLTDKNKELADLLANEMFKLMLSVDIGKMPINQLIAMVVEQTLYLSILNTFYGVEKDEDLSPKQKLDLASDEYNKLKFLVQDTVAEAFSKGLSKFSGQQVDYYCQIKPTPPIANKEPI